MYRKSKYNNTKAIVDGIIFDSKKEARRYKELKLMEKAGAITELQLQPEFILTKSRKLNGKTIRQMKYIADFQYIKDGQTYVEDVKGYKTDTYVAKMKFFLEKFGDTYKFIEV